MSELRWEPPSSGADSNEIQSRSSNGPSRWSVGLLVVVMIGAAFALGIGVMRIVDASDDYGGTLRSSRDAFSPVAVPAAVELVGR